MNSTRPATGAARSSARVGAKFASATTAVSRSVSDRSAELSTRLREGGRRSRVFRSAPAEPPDARTPGTRARQSRARRRMAASPWALEPWRLRSASRRLQSSTTRSAESRPDEPPSTWTPLSDSTVSGAPRAATAASRRASPSQCVAKTSPRPSASTRNRTAKPAEAWDLAHVSTSDHRATRARSMFWNKRAQHIQVEVESRPRARQSSKTRASRGASRELRSTKSVLPLRLATVSAQASPRFDAAVGGPGAPPSPAAR